MTNKSRSTVTLLAGGDIAPGIEPVDEIAEKVLPALREADLRFAQCERTYSERGWPPHFGSDSGGHARAPTRVHPRLASIWQTAGIDVISMASNHTMDWGPEALLDTHALFKSMGKHVIGAGSDGEDARKPAIVERNGVRIAFLGYCTVLRPGAAAGPGKPGCAPMRAHTYYEQVDWQAGAPPKVVTVPYEEDLRALKEDVQKAKARADVVVLSMHWGLHHMPKTICDYQPVVAHAAIDAGADLIVGHHAHCIKAIEVYKGKVCFYSLGNFMTSGGESRLVDPARRNVWNLWWFRVEPECLPPQGMYYFPDEARRTMIAKAVFSRSGVERVSFLPAYVNGKGQPELLSPSDSRFEEVLEFTEWVSDCHPHRFRVEGAEIVVEAGDQR